MENMNEAENMLNDMIKKINYYIDETEVTSNNLDLYCFLFKKAHNAVLMPDFIKNKYLTKILYYMHKNNKTHINNEYVEINIKNLDIDTKTMQVIKFNGECRVKN